MKVTAKSAGIGTLVGMVASIWAIWYNAPVPPRPPIVWEVTADLSAFDSAPTPPLVLTDVRWEQPAGETTITIDKAIEHKEPVVAFGAGATARIISALTPYDGSATRAKQTAATQDVWAAEVGTSSMAPPFPHRKGIEWTINRDLIRRRFNLWLLPNVHEGPHECDGEWMAGVPPKLWQNAGFRMAQGVDANGMFPVRIQRRRAGVLTTVTTVWVPAGPTPRGIQISFKSVDWAEGDILRIPLDSELLLVSCDPYTSHVIEPRLSGVEVAGGDSTPLPGKMVKW